MSVYRITRLSCGHVLDVHTRKQFPAAKAVLWDACHDMLAGDGALASPVAWRMYRAANAISRDVHSATFECDGTRSSVTIERVE